MLCKWLEEMPSQAFHSLKHTMSVLQLSDIWVIKYYSCILSLYFLKFFLYEIGDHDVDEKVTRFRRRAVALFVGVLLPEIQALN